MKTNNEIIEISKERDGAFAVVDIDTLWENKKQERKCAGWADIQSLRESQWRMEIDNAYRCFTVLKII